MPRIVEYSVEWGESLDELVRRVNAQMKHGLQPLGGVSAMCLPWDGFANSMRFFQSMVRCEEECESWQLPKGKR